MPLSYSWLYIVPVATRLCFLILSAGLETDHKDFVSVSVSFLMSLTVRFLKLVIIIVIRGIGEWHTFVCHFAYGTGTGYIANPLATIPLVSCIIIFAYLHRMMKPGLMTQQQISGQPNAGYSRYRF